MQGRCRTLWLIVLLIAACGTLPPIPGMPTKPRMGAERALNRLTGGHLDAEGVRMMEAVGPRAVQAVATIGDAVHVRVQGEIRVRELVIEEDLRLLVAASQSFYTDECSSTPAPPSVASVDPSNLGGMVQPEREASEAFRSGDFKKADSLLKGVSDTLEKQFGANHPVVLRLLHKRTAIQLAVGNSKQGIVFATRTLASRELSLRNIKPTNPPGHDEIAAGLAVAESANMIANIYRNAGAYSDARQSYERAIELRTRYLGGDQLCAAQSQNGLGELLLLTGDYPAARRLLESAHLIRQAKLGPRHRDTVRSLNDLASLYGSIGDLLHAQELYQRSDLGQDDVDAAEWHHHLGGLHMCGGDYVKAELEYQQALDIRMKKFGEGVETAQSQSALAGVYQAMGDYDRAEGLHRGVYDILQSKLGPDDPRTIDALSDLGDSHLALGDYTRAESDYNQVLEFWRKQLGSDSPKVAKSLLALGNVHVARGDYTRAESEYNQALNIQQKLGPDHNKVVEAQHYLGLLYQAKGDYARAESFYSSELSLLEKKLGAAHPLLVESLVSLAKLMMATGRNAQALQYARRAFGISEQLLQSIGMVAGDSRLDAQLRSLRTQEEVAYSLLLGKSPPDDAATFALSVALLRKGRSLDEAAYTSRVAHQGVDAAARDQGVELLATRAELAKLTADGSGDATARQRLVDRVDEIEQALAKHSAPLRARRTLARPSDIVARVAQVLPPDGVLVEIVAFRPWVLHARAQNAGNDPQRYLALVLHHDASVRVVSLGLGDPIDRLISVFRKQLARAPDKDNDTRQVLVSAEALYHSVFQPVRTQFMKVDKNIFLSLDSQLHLVPFAAFFDGKQYLVETYQFTYLTSGRDLLHRDVGLRDNTTVAVIANPEFIKGGSNGPVPPSATCPRGMTIEEKHDWLGSLCPLPGTVEEAQDIRQLLPGARVFVGNSATKAAFLGLQSPGILHVATHGVFFGNTGHAVAGQRPEIESDRAALLNSMLMLAGAGIRSEDGTLHVQSEGVATALEVAGMNLWGTQLVVLSACETGVGEVSNLGQGVYGLRRAVMIAGSETLVTSLWKVDDSATREMMRRYYEGLLDGQGRVEAMRVTADWMRRRPTHPHYWAAFVVVGARDPLVGISRKRQPAVVTPVVAGSR